MTTRKSYHRWCGLWVDSNAWEKRVIAADQKRVRKAAKRRRDAELTRLGREAARWRVTMVTQTTIKWSPVKRWSWRVWETALHTTRRLNTEHRRWMVRSRAMVALTEARK